MENLLSDGAGRRIEYLRISVTDRCDLKCAYCMPPGGSEHAPACDIMPLRDFLRLAEIFARLGIRKIRVTGGEPLLRRGVAGFIGQLKQISGIGQLALTTNGINLSRMAGRIREAGVSKINISLDSLRRERYEQITGRDGFSNVMEGVQAAMGAGFDSVKINVVAIKGVNDDEIEDFAAFTRSMKLQVRFIEFMPASRSVWSEEKFIPVSSIMEQVGAMGKLIPCAKSQWGGPAQVYRLERAVGEIGFISAVSRHFCGECNRLRLTSTGKLMTCLFGADDLDLRGMMESGADDAAIATAIRDAVARKNPVRSLPACADDFAARPSMTCVGG
ncbi:MAG: GTP 3',8-cyclase MoaA [Nitrospinae bacterium]|nr:GTP 3',8-cyclase MoaA [Nitrospinota bacterium]